MVSLNRWIILPKVHKGQVISADYVSIELVRTQNKLYKQEFYENKISKPLKQEFVGVRMVRCFTIKF